MAAAQDSQKEKDNAPKCPVDHSTFKHFLPKDAMPEGHPPVSAMNSEGEPAKCPVSPEAHKHFMPRNTQVLSNTQSSTAASSSSASSSTSSSASESSKSVPASTSTLPTTSLKIDPTNNMPTTPDQFRIASQTRDLNTEREVSSIPKAPNAADPYNEKGSGNHAADPDGSADVEKVWIYPSEQMFFNAMKRKNWNPREEDMKFVVPIHNMVNEMAWKHILKWEKNME
ncbi:Cytochrome c1 heme lyase, partial [Podila humilis]